MNSNPQTIQLLHQRNVTLFSQYRQLETKLLEALQVFDENKGYQKMGFSSLFDYCLKSLGMSEGQACTFIKLARTTRKIPELKMALESKAITLSSAKVIAPLLTVENQKSWIEKAALLPKAALEREVSKVNPKLAKPDRISPINATQSQGQFVLSQRALEILKRVKELESKKTSSSCDLDAAIIAMGTVYLKKNDPVEKATRIKVSAPRSGKTMTRRIPQPLIHKVNLRDRGMCRVESCKSKNFTQIHHVRPYSVGGDHRLSNLVTICAGHHRAIHQGATLKFSA